LLSTHALAQRARVRGARLLPATVRLLLVSRT
jgi:hypothetical protein